MRHALIPALVAIALLGLATLPSGYAQNTPGATSQYLPLVFKAAHTPTLTNTVAVPTATQRTTPTATLSPTRIPTSTIQPTATRDPSKCAAEYPTVCIPPPPPDLDCGDITFRNFRVNPPDRHKFDTDNDGIGCET